MAKTAKRKIKIKGTGFYTPDKILSNFDLEKMVDTSDEWIVTRTGIKERRIASEDQMTSDLGVEAGLAALKNAGLKVKDVDLIITATSTPDLSSRRIASPSRTQNRFSSSPLEE